MKPFATIALLALVFTAACLTGCSNMDEQPSFMPQEAPRLKVPAEAVSFEAWPRVTWQSQLENPVIADEASLARGEELYLINCALCHGTRDTYLGPVGQKLSPPPPSLHDERIGNLTDSDMIKRISLGFGRMPAFQDLIGYIDRWHLVNYVGTFR